MKCLGDAHKKGLHVTWDVYPYAAWGGSFEDLFTTCEMDYDKLIKLSHNNELEIIKKEQNNRRSNY